MDNFKTSEEVAKKIETLMRKLYKVCSENGVPLVIGAGMERKETASKVLVSRVTTVHLDEETGCTDSSIRAAFEILQIREIPELFIAGLQIMREELDSECDCPECRAERERISILH
ncbi:TPA: hypothetical protein N2G38_002200 [Salmonella enterica]|nr:hypothetical protein [Salmonella enterica]